MIGPDKGWGNSLFALGERRFWRPARTGPAMKLSLCGLCGGNEKTTSCRNGIKTTWRSDGLSWRHLGQRRAEVSPVGSEGLRGPKTAENAFKTASNGQKTSKIGPKRLFGDENGPKLAETGDKLRMARIFRMRTGKARIEDKTARNRDSNCEIREKREMGPGNRL